MKITKRSTALVKLAEDGSKLSYCSDELRNDRELVLIAVKNNGIALLYAPKSYLNDIEIVKEAVKTYGCILGSLNESFCANKSICLEAVKNTPMAVEYLSEELKDDDDIANIAIRNDGESIQYFSKRIRSNLDYASMAIQASWWSIEHVDPILYREKSIRLAAVKGFLEFIKKYNHYYSRSFDFSDLYNEWLDDREIVELLCEHISIHNIADNFKSDKELVLKILKYSPFGYGHIAAELHKDKEIALQVINFGITPKYLLNYLDAELKMDRDINYNLVLHNPSYYKKLPKAFKDDREFILLATSLDGSIYESLHRKFKIDPDIIISSISSGYPADLYSIPPDIIKNNEEIKLAIKSSNLARMRRLHPDKSFLEDFVNEGRPEFIEYTDYRDGGKLVSIKPEEIEQINYRADILHKSELKQPHLLKFTCVDYYSDYNYFYVFTNIIYRNYDFWNFKELTPFNRNELNDLLEWKLVKLRFKYPRYSCEFDFTQKLKELCKKGQELTFEIIMAECSYNRNAMCINLELSDNMTIFDRHGNPLKSCQVILEDNFPMKLDATKKFIFNCLGINLEEYSEIEMAKYFDDKERAEAAEKERKRLLEIKKAKMITPEKRMEIYKMVNEGKSHEQIAEVFGVDKSTIIRNYKKALEEIEG